MPPKPEASAAQQPRVPLWAFYIGALLVLTGVILTIWQVPALDEAPRLTLGVLTAATLAAEIFTVDFPDHKRISGSYIFPLLASAVVSPAAGVMVAGVAGAASGALRQPRLRSMLFHAPQLALAAAAGAALQQAVFGGGKLELSLPAAGGLVVYMAAYTGVAWGLGCVEELLAGKPATHASTDALTNLLLVPLPLALAAVYERTSLNGLLLSALALALLLIVVRAYVNLATLHGELEQTYTKLAEQECQLEDALQTNREMSQVVSHDLRGPLTSVMGYTELLRGNLGKPEPDPDKNLRYVVAIEGNSRRILSLADKLLDLHRLEESDPVERADVDLADVLTQLVADARVQAEQRSLQLELAIADSVPVLQSSGWMVREIAENLLSNAIKYSHDAGHVAISLSAGSGEVLLAVEDDGIGMSAEDQGRLFTKFFRSGNEAVRSVSGTGLGLALTHTMIERLGGRIEVRSELGRGSSFTVHLPLGD